MTTAVRPGLPELPDRIKRLPVDHRGYPVPWFVQYIDGKPDFRIMDGAKLRRIIQGERHCWVCGEQLGRYLAFVIGPMCAVNRVSSEPPSHRECATFSAIACPFLSRPHMRRREDELTEIAKPAGGLALKRNPGVALVWVTKSFRIVPPSEGGWLFRVGDPLAVECYAEGRLATPEEIRASIDSGFPLLREAAEQDGPAAITALEQQTQRARQLLKIA